MKGNKKQPATVALYIKGIPRHVRQAFKAWCIVRNIPMQDKIVSMMKECIKDTRLPGASSQSEEEEEES